MKCNKKWVYFIVLVPILLCINSFTVHANSQNEQTKTVTFTRDKFEYTITKNATQKEMGDVSISLSEQFKETITYAEIPQTVIYKNLVYRVRVIKGKAFANCTNLITVTVPNSVISIESRAFYKCTSLTRIMIPDSVLLIKNSAFDSCSTKLTFACSTKSEAYNYAKENGIKLKVLNTESSRKLIVVGDSRTYNMSNWVMTTVPTKFIAKSGQGYSWFTKEGIKRVNSVKNSGDVIIVWLGVNDYFSSDLGGESWKVYANKINSLAKNEWYNCTVYVAAVGYVDSAKMKAYYGKTSRANVSSVEGNKIKGIQEFNTKLKQALDIKVKWLDTYKTIGISHNDTDNTPDDIWLTRENGKKDGLHYSQKKTQQIYDFFVKKTMN